MLLAGREDFFELGHLLLRGHLERLDLVGLVGESAVQAQDHVPLGAEGLVFGVVAECD